MTNGEDFCREVLNILTCVRALAPIASQGPALPPRAREANGQEKNYDFYMSKNKNIETASIKKPSEGASVSRYVRIVSYRMV